MIVENTYYLVYEGSTLKMGGYALGKKELSSIHNKETFDTAQELVDRGVDLGLSCDVDYMLQALEHGAIFPGWAIDYLNSEAPNMDPGRLKRLEALEL